MSVVQFKDVLKKLISHQRPNERAVFFEMLEHFFPGQPAGEVQRVHAEAYEVNGTTVIVSRFGSERSKCLVVDYETGDLLCKE